MQAALRHPLYAFVAMPLLVLMAIVGSLAPWVGVFFLLLAVPQLLGTLPSLALAALDQNQPPQPSLLVHGFRHYERWLGIFGVAYLVTVALSLPLIVAFWLRLRVLAGIAGTWTFYGGFAVSATLWLLLFRRYVLVPFVAADLPKSVPMQAVLDCAVSLYDSDRVRMSVGSVALLGCAASGVLLAKVGLVVTVPIGVCGMAALYRSVRSADGHGEGVSFSE